MLFKNTNQEADYSVNENAVFDEDTNMSSNEGGIIDDQALQEAFISGVLWMFSWKSTHLLFPHAFLIK